MLLLSDPCLPSPRLLLHCPCAWCPCGLKHGSIPSLAEAHAELLSLSESRHREPEAHPVLDYLARLRGPRAGHYLWYAAPAAEQLSSANLITSSRSWSRAQDLRLDHAPLAMSEEETVGWTDPVHKHGLPLLRLDGLTQVWPRFRPALDTPWVPVHVRAFR